MTDSNLITYYSNQAITPTTVPLPEALERLKTEASHDDSWVLIDGVKIETENLTQQMIEKAEVIDVIIQAIGG